MNLTSRLILNLHTYELTYAECSKNAETNLIDQIGKFTISLVAWPLIFIFNAIALPVYSVKYIKASWHQFRCVKILNNSSHLNRYSIHRLEKTERRIESLKKDAIFYIEDYLDDQNRLNLSFPSKMKLKDLFSSNRLIEERWRNFDWNQFLQKDFLHDIENCSSKDRITCKNLEIIKIKINRLVSQKNLLSNSTEKLNVFKKIVELSFIKNGIHKEKCKEWLGYSSICLLPSAIYWKIGSSKARSVYENQKKHLEPVLNLHQYHDLVDAHNQLIKTHDFLIPYLKKTLI